MLALEYLRHRDGDGEADDGDDERVAQVGRRVVHQRQLGRRDAGRDVA